MVKHILKTLQHLLQDFFNVYLTFLGYYALKGLIECHYLTQRSPDQLLQKQALRKNQFQRKV